MAVLLRGSAAGFHRASGSATRWPSPLRLKRRWRDGTTHVVFEPGELLERLIALIPPPRAHQVRYHGVLAPAALGRAAIWIDVDMDSGLEKRVRAIRDEAKLEAARGEFEELKRRLRPESLNAPAQVTVRQTVDVRPETVRATNG